MDRCNGINLLDEQRYLPLDRCNGKTQVNRATSTWTNVMVKHRMNRATSTSTDVMGKNHMMYIVIFTWSKNYSFECISYV